MPITPRNPRLPRPPRAYFSQRAGRGPQGERPTFAALAKMLAAFLARLRESGYLDQAFGFACVDSGAIPGELGEDPDAYFEIAIGRRRIWPFDAEIVVVEAEDEWFRQVNIAWHQWDADIWFDVLEVLYDVVSQPTDGWMHDYNGCGWHFSDFDKQAGQELFRDEINWILSQNDPPYEMTSRGEIVAAAPDGFGQLVVAEVPPGTEEDEVLVKLGDALSLFRARGATDADRLRAVRELADVLEHLRTQMKDSMLAGDESDLFQIINRFAVRHNNPNQLRNYDRGVWHRWMFYVFLATIHAVLRVREREGHE